jgi:ABC-type phosphate transport system substrate-binding protein
VRLDRFLRVGVAMTFGVVAVGAVAPDVAPVGAAVGRTVLSTPATGLLDGQFVTISWAGFAASRPPLSYEAVSISQCKATPVHPMTDCAPSVSGVSNKTGAGVVSLQVHTGSVLAQNAATRFTCDHATVCTIAVYHDPAEPITPPTPGFPTATAPISFGFPPDDCPHGGAGVGGTGSEAVNRVMLAWEASVCQPPTSLDLQYTRTESTDGKESFVGKPGFPMPDFAVTSVPFSATDLAAIKAQNRTFGYAPVAASGLVFAFHGTDRITGQQLTHLTLTPSQLAHIFNGKRYSMPTSASDAESRDIIDLNPGTSFSPNLLAFGRLDGAAGSLEATSFFLSTAAAAWKDVPPYVANRSSRNGGPSEVVDYSTPTENMPDGLEGPGASNQLVNGPDILAVTLAGQGQGVGNDPATLNLGYLDASTAAFYGLPSVCIQMDAKWRTTHTPCVKATPQSIAGALAIAKRNPDGTVTPNWNPSNRAAYPMPDVSYLVAPTNLGPTAKAHTLQKVIQFAVAHGPSSGIVPPGYAELPSDLSNVALSTAAAITNKPAGERPPPTPPTTTPRTTTSTTTPASGPFDPGAGSPGGISDFVGSSFGNDPGTAPTTVPVTTATTIPTTKPSKPKRASQSLEKVAFAKAGDQISGHASWAILIALSLFCLLGLLFRPVRALPRIAKRRSWLRLRSWRRTRSAVRS